MTDWSTGGNESEYQCIQEIINEVEKDDTTVEDEATDKVSIIDNYKHEKEVKELSSSPIVTLDATKEIGTKAVYALNGEQRE